MADPERTHTLPLMLLSAEAISTSPLEEPALWPLIKVTLPPAPELLSPPETHTAPPAWRSAVLPTMLTMPAEPDSTAAPPPIVTLPALHAELLPARRHIFPPALVEPAPAMTLTLPPLPVPPALLPPLKEAQPPVLPSPALLPAPIHTLPLPQPDDEPEVKHKLPLLPATELPVDTLTSPLVLVPQPPEADAIQTLPLLPPAVLPPLLNDTLPPVLDEPAPACRQTSPPEPSADAPAHDNEAPSF